MTGRQNGFEPPSASRSETAKNGNDLVTTDPFRPLPIYRDGAKRRADECVSKASASQSETAKNDNLSALRVADDDHDAKIVLRRSEYSHSAGTEVVMAHYDFIVVGGGPAGMMAAGRAAERGKRALLLERGPSLGRKLLITGSGRCNVTNTAPLHDLIKAFGREGDFLRHAFTIFGNDRLLAWLHTRGVETIEERKGCIFPASQDAHTILDALTAYLSEGNVEVQCAARVTGLEIRGGRVTDIRLGHKTVSADRVLIATGGLSYPTTGCSGDGYELAKQVGHTIFSLSPAIVALETAETWPRKVQGTPIKNVSILATSTKKGRGRKIAEVFGEALWTHYGISGPAILDISRKVVLELREGAEVQLELDLRPSDTEEALDERLLHAIKKKGNVLVRSVIAEWVPERTASVLTELAEIEPRKKMNQCSRSDRKRLVKTLKHLCLHVTRPRPIEESIVTGGGVSLAEVDAKTMESRLVKGLHFAGEVLDIDGPSGGYNLQAAFSTGYLVGQSV